LNLSATTSVLEGGTITYTATLSHAAETDMTIGLTNGQSITIEAGSTSGTVNVTASDDVYIGADAVTAGIAQLEDQSFNITGGNFENLVVGTASATTTVSDVDTDVTLNLSATTSVLEGGTITYTATLSHAAETEMTIGLTNGQSITIAAGSTSGTVNVTASDDVYVGADAVTAGIAQLEDQSFNITGGNFENLVVETSSVTTSVSDADTDVTLNLSATSSVLEGGTITYTATLSHAAETEMTIGLTNGQSITIEAGSTSGTVNVTASDDVYVGADAVTTGIVQSEEGFDITGGNFENLVVETSSVTTSVSDADTDVTLNLSATSSVLEGGTITYTATLSHAAETEMTIGLTNGQSITIAAGSTSGTVNVTASDDVYVGADAATTGIAQSEEGFNITGGNFENLVVGIASATTTVLDVDTDVTLNLSATSSVLEGGTIAYTATLSHAAETEMTIALTNGQSITIEAGSTSGTVNVTASDDVY
ncbi:immunoglobulin-like domain-containing protein, partial [Catenovulum sediminis]